MSENEMVISNIQFHQHHFYFIEFIIMLSPSVHYIQNDYIRAHIVINNFS